MQNNNATTVKGNYNSNQNQMNRQQGIKGQNNINQNIQANNIPQGNKKVMVSMAFLSKIILILLEYL